MADCEHRIGGPTNGGSVNIDGKTMPVAASGNTPLCKVRAEDGDLNNVAYPVCDLPTLSGQECPIAKFRRGELTIDQTNAALTALYAAMR